MESLIKLVETLRENPQETLAALSVGLNVVLIRRVVKLSNLVFKLALAVPDDRREGLDDDTTIVLDDLCDRGKKGR